MKKFFLKTMLLALVLGMGTNAVMADETPEGQTVFLAAFKAQSSDESTGAGKVKLTWVDAQGKLFDNTAVAWLNYNLPPFNMPYGTGNPSNNNEFDDEAMLIGATLTATESVEDSDPKSSVTQVLRNLMFNAGADSSHLYMTPFAYFKADAQGDNGSYFAGWTFNDARVWKQDTAMDKSASESAYFKVLPYPTNVMYMTPPSTVVGLEDAYAGAVEAPNNIYAVFNRYLLSNSTATSGQLEAVAGNTATLYISFEVNGDVSQFKESYADFDFPAQSFYEDANGTWTWDFAATPVEIVSANKARAHAVITYTAKSGIAAGTHNATLTVRMQGENPSTLNIALSVVALNPDRPEALLLDGKTEQTVLDGEDEPITSLEGLLAVDFSSYTNPVIKLNKKHADAITLPNKNFTLDLNGNEAGAITIEGGNVTIAYSKFGGSAASLTVNGGKAILNGGTFGSLTIGESGTVEQNGATITGAASNGGTLTTTAGTINGGLTSSKTLTLNGGTFNGTTAVTISGGTADINRGDITGTSLGLKVTGGTATVKKLAVITSDDEDDESDADMYSAQRTGGTLNVESGKFGKPLNGTINFTAGYFKDQSYGVSTEGKKEYLISAGVEYNEGYRYFLGSEESALANGVGVCRIGEVSYSKLEDALAYANNNPNEELVIFMTNNYTLPAGYYTLPAKATIVVPMSDSQEKEINYVAPRLVYNDVNSSEANRYSNNPLSEFRRLTFASGVNMDVFGDIELTSTQYSTNEAYTSQPVGPYGRLVMEEGSRMTLQNGSELRAWGFMTGKGETDARRGATVREMFQMGDWKGAMTSVAITGMAPQFTADYSDRKIFPVTQYFIQNIESPVKYHPGAVLSTSAAVSEGVAGMSVSMAAPDIAIVGVSGEHTAIFLMDQMADADNTWVRKWYDAENDIQVYDINSGAHIGSMELDMGELSLMGYTVPVRLNSAMFDLPITSNFKIHLLSGSMDFEQNTCLLPGSEVEVDKEAVVGISMSDEDKANRTNPYAVLHTGAVYVYDAADWGTFAYPNKYTKVVRYAPSWNGCPTKRSEDVCPPSATINVHGLFNTKEGYVYTSEHGANIYSSNEDAGTFMFMESASEAGERTVYQIQGKGTDESHYQTQTFTSAQLRNGEGSYTNTESAGEGDAYCYQNDKWSTMVIDGCFVYEIKGGETIYYAKPQDYVALANGDEPNADNTYSDAAGTGRLFILMSEGCQWWEVENVDNLYHCIHPNNDTYYEWDDTENEWKEKTFTITWKNWNGDIIQTMGKVGQSYQMVDSYKVTYGTMAEFLGTNPTRESNIDYTYDFTGWTPALGPVTSDVTYTATFEQKDRMYTIIFCQEGGVEIERQFLKHNDVPVCENTPTKVGHTLVWDPAIAAVTGDATYTATWLENPPTEYEVTFFDYDGTTELQKGKVAVGAMPVYNGETPTGKAEWAEDEENKEFTYVFDHWSPALELVSATSIKSYTAVYREVAVKYNVRFEDENGDEIETNQYAYGETPVCSATPTKENTAEWTYGFAWTPQIQTVMGDATYRATFPATKNKYTVTLTSNLSGVCTFTGAGTFDYGTEITNVAVSYNDTKYTFNGWSDSETNAAHSSFELTGDITLTANFTPIALSDHTVGKNDTWTVDEDTEVKDLIITSDGSACGQLLNPENLTIRGEAIFRQQQSFAAGTWYAVAVPWRVDPNTGIYGSSSRLASGSQIYIIEFDGAAYANVGGTEDTYQYWHFLHQTGADMVPGKLYMIYLTSGQSKLDFHKKAGAALQTRNLTVSTATSSIDPKYSNWNAIANPALYTADLSTGAAKYQTYDNNDGQTYTVQDAATNNLIVAKPIFVQVSTPGTVYATVPSGASPAPAYRRAQKAENDTKFVVEIARDGKMADRLIVETADEKEDKYVIGQDLAKFGVSSKVAQMWVNRYNAKLCANTVAWDGERAEYPLNIFAPAAGEYRITINNSQFTIHNEDYALYLTLNGEAIANLSDGNYTLTLEKGNTSVYGLRVSARAPQITTGVDEAVVNAQGETAAKVLINNQVFIIRGEKVYTIDGQLVK